MSEVPHVVQRLLTEDMLSLAQAARRFPASRGAHRPSPSAIWRWVRDGVHKTNGGVVKLEACLVAGRWLTSSQALVRFITLQQPDQIEQTESPKISVRAPSGATGDAADELARLGL